MNIEEYSKYIQMYSGCVPDLLVKYLNNKDWNSFLDLGCGDGSLLYSLNQGGYLKDRIVYAVDLSKNRIDLVQKINKNFICFVNSACDLKDIKTGSINLLVSEQTIEHVESDESMIKEIKRVLSKGGTAYISTVFKKWYGWYFYKCNKKSVLDPTHLREYTNDEQLLKIIGRNNLSVLEDNKVLIWRSPIDFILKKVSQRREISNNNFLSFLRSFKVPIFGYYIWEIVCKNS